MMDTGQQDLYAKIANMVAIDVPQKQIAQVVGLSEGRISQIVASEEFAPFISQEAGSRFQQMDTLNRGWDMVEEVALGHVGAACQAPNIDPEFALKVAVMANKAKRRGQLHDKPIAGQMGARAVITLTATFVDKLQQNFQLPAQTASPQLPQKETDFMAPAALEQIMQSASLVPAAFGQSSLDVTQESEEEDNDGLLDFAQVAGNFA